MTDYVCPERITAYFEDATLVDDGRQLAVEWAASLDLKPGDRVWLPEIGWTQKDGGKGMA